MSSANGRIIRNTGLLYFRLIFLTFINLYAVRITLEALGVKDYGIYDVVASVVGSLSILTGALTSATQRFLSFHLGKKDFEKYSHTFTLLLMSFMAMAVALIIIGEILGYFFIHDWLKIPDNRITAAYWLFQASLVAFAFGLLTIPYTSSIVANEKMDAFAIFSIVEGILKLATAYILVKYGGDRLIMYGILTAVTSMVVFFMSMQYCHSKFKYCKYVWKWDRNIFTELSQYTGWNLFGSISGMLATQGQNILLNIFFGPIINASKAIADKIQHVINSFSINLYMAVSPQIIKSYAAEDYQRAMNLVMKTSKMSFLLIFLLSFPLISNMDGLLGIWLAADAKTPDMVAFSKLILVYSMILSLEPPISRIIQATGKIKRYQLSVGAITLSFIPIAALVLALGGSAIFTLVVLIGIMSLAQGVRLMVAHRQVGLNYTAYLKTVLLPILKVSLVGAGTYLALESFVHSKDTLMILLHTATAAVFALFIVAILGLDKSDRTFITELVKKRLNKSSGNQV